MFVPGEVFATEDVVTVFVPLALAVPKEHWQVRTVDDAAMIQAGKRQLMRLFILCCMALIGFVRMPAY